MKGEKGMTSRDGEQHRNYFRPLLDPCIGIYRVIQGCRGNGKENRK